MLEVCSPKPGKVLKTPRKSSLTSGASGTACLDCNKSEVRAGDPPLPDSKPGLVVRDKAVPVRLFVRPRLAGIFGPVSRTGRSRSMTGGHSPTRRVSGRTCLLFGPVKALLGCTGPALGVLRPQSVQCWGLCDPFLFPPRCCPEKSTTALRCSSRAESSFRLPSVTKLGT